jgi:hypothetical protein
VSPHEEKDGGFGLHVSTAGDVNGDGYDDVVVGAWWEDPGSSPEESGRAYVFDGQTNTLLHTLVSPNEESDGEFGWSVSGAGDVNSDGSDDVVVGAPNEDPGSSPDGTGRAYVFDGPTGNLLHTLVSPDEREGGRFGCSVSGAGDANHDGYDDVIVGASFEGAYPSPTWAGRAYVFDGPTGALLHTLVSPNEEYCGYFGISVSGAGDTNGDCYDDVVVGAWWEDPGSSPEESGRAYVFDGPTGTVLHTLVSPNETWDGYFGDAVSGAGDIDGDGYDDIVIGARNERPGSSPSAAGRAYVFDGETGTLLYTLVSPNEEAYGRFGYSVSSAGDIDGDGYDDVVVGTLAEDPGASPEQAGRAYVFDGPTGNPLYTLVSPNEEEYGRFGISVSGAGDINGDGYDDVVVGAYHEDPGSSPEDAGRAYVFSWMSLTSRLTGDAVELQWSTWSPASEYWIYGADNLRYFEPGFYPSYQYKLDAVVPPATTWSSSSGVGDSDHNWTYLVIAVEGSEHELARSNRVGEHDFGTEIP